MNFIDIILYIYSLIYAIFRKISGAKNCVTDKFLKQKTFSESFPLLKYELYYFIVLQAVKHHHS